VAEFILDTHACLFALAAPKKLGRRARAALRRVDAGRDQAWIPAAVATEIALLRELGRTDIGLPQLRSALENAPNWHFLPLDLDQVDEFSALAAIRDPFDRLIVAAARRRGAKLVSRDERLNETGLVEIVWT